MLARNLYQCIPSFYDVGQQRAAAAAREGYIDRKVSIVIDDISPAQLPSLGVHS